MSVCRFCAYVFPRPGLAHDGRDMCPMCYTPLDEMPEATAVHETVTDDDTGWCEAWWDAYIEREED